MNWMDRQRKELIAYEYLCHVGEAQQWIEGCLDEELGYGVVEMEESMTDGVALAKLARKYEGDEVVRHIWEVSHWILANVLASDKGLTDPVL
jgi:Ras GTPase-activating-like protein IQGAP2/3